MEKSEIEKLINIGYDNGNSCKNDYCNSTLNDFCYHCNNSCNFGQKHDSKSCIFCYIENQELNIRVLESKFKKQKEVKKNK